MILYIENPKDTTRKLLELINVYRKVAGYKINKQKSLAFLYINNEKTKIEIKEIILFTINTKRDEENPHSPLQGPQTFQKPPELPIIPVCHLSIGAVQSVYTCRSGVIKGSDLSFPLF